MALIRDRVGDRYNDYLYGVQDNVAKYAKSLQDSGYIPNENEGLLDSLQSGLWGGLGGLLGGASALAKEQGWDGIANWTGNEAQHAGNRAQANAYTGKWEEGNYLNYALNQGAQALGSSVPSLIGDIATTAAIGTVAGGPVGTALGAVVGAGKWANRLYEGSKLVQYGAKAGKFATGVVAGGLIENATNAGDTYMTGLQRGMDHSQSYDAMKTTFNEGWAPAMANYAFDKISMQGSLGSGITSAFATGGGKVLAKGAVATAVNAGVGAVGEAVTEAWQQQIQEKALGTPEYKNVNIYDPTSWTQDMKDQAFDAGVGSIPLGLISGTFSSGKTLSQKENEKKNQLALEQAEQAMNATPTLGENPVTTTPSEEGGDVDLGEATPTAMPEAPSTDGENASLDLSEETPENMVERPRDELDDAFDTLNHAHYKKQGKSDDDILEMNNNARATTEMIHQKWEEHTPEAKYSPNAFVPDFREQGYTEKDARKLSRATVEMYEKKQPKESSNEPTLVERAESIGYNLSDEDKESIDNGTMPKAIMGSIEKNIIAKEKEVAETREQERKVQEENQKREEYNNHYKDSVNKGFLEEAFRAVPDGPNKDQLIRDTGYAIREATSEYNKEHAEHKSGKRKNKPVGLQNKLAQKGIKSGNTYTREQVDNIVDHVEDIQKTRKDNPTTTKDELRKRGFENASLGKIDNAFGNRRTKNKINVKAEKNDKRFENFYLDEANKLIETAKATGLPVERSKTYKAIREKSTQGFRNIQDALFPKVEAPKKEGVKKEKSVQEQLFTPIEDNKNTGNLTKKQKKQLKQAENERKLKEAQAKLEEENKTGENVIENNELAEQARLEQEKEEEAKEAIERYGKEQKEKDENEEGPDDEWIESAIADEDEEKKTREAFEEKGNKESVNTKEKPKANTKKSWSKEDSHAVVDRYLNGEINKEQAINELVEHEGKVTRKNKEYIQKLKKSVNYYNDKKEETRKKANNEKEMTNMINGIDSSITALKEQIENGTTENKDYDRKVESIKKKIKDAYLKHPSLLKTHPNLEQSIPLGKPINKKKLLDEIESGERELTRREITNLLNSPAKFIRDLTGWVRKVVNNPDINLQQPEINKVVKRIIDDEYKDIIDAYGSIEKAVASSQGRGRVRTFSKAVAGLFPKEHFHNSLIKSQKDRQKALKLTDRGLATSKTRGDLDKYKDIAKRFFKDEFEPDTKDKEFLVATAIAEEAKPKKEDGRKYNNVKPAITLKSVEDLGEDTFRYTLDFDKEKGWTAEQIKNDFVNLVTPYTDNMFIDSEVNNVEINEEAGTITFEGEPMLSYKDFSDTMESSTKANDKKTSLEARAMVVSAAIDTAPDRVVELALDKKDVPVVQKYLNDTFGNDKYGVYEGEEIQHLTKNTEEETRLEGTFFIYSKEEYPTVEELEKAMDNEYFYAPNYQFGKDSETEQSISQQKEEYHNILKGLTNNYNEQQRLSDNDITLAYQGINNYTKGLGARRAVFRLLGKGKNVYHLGFTTRKELDFNALADTHTGRIEVTKQGINSGSSALLHEVAHLAVDAISMAGSLDQPRHPLWKQLTDVIKEGKADYENIKHQMGDSEGDIRVPVSSGENSVRGRIHEGTTRDSLEGNEGSGSEHQRGGGPSDMQSGLQGETLELDNGRRSGNSEVGENGRNVDTRQNEQLQSDLEQVHVRGRDDNGGNSGRGILTEERRTIKGSINRRILRRWNLAEKLIETATKENAEQILTDVRNTMNNLHGKSDMYHEEKAHALISLVDAMFKIDNKLGNTKFTESLTYQLLTDIENGTVKPNTLLHETFAYSSHTVMSGEMQKSFFDKATEHLNPDIIKDNQTKDSTQVTQQKQQTEEEQQAQKAEQTEAEKQAQKEEKEAKEQPIVAAGKKLAKEVGKRIGSQTPDNVQIITRDERSGNITAWGLKKWFASPIRMIQKFIPQAKAMVRWAEDAENHQTKLMTGYYKLFDKMKKAIGDKVDEFKKLTGEINSLGRDFIQTVAVNHAGKEYYVNLTDNDIFEEYMDEASAKERYKELKNDGHKVFMDFKENKWRVLASADSLKVLPSYRQAKELARTQTIERIKEKGYSNEVANAYNHWITLRERIYRDKVEAWKESGQPEEQRPKLLWGYTPSLHGKYGFYKVRVVRDDNGKVFSHYDKIASFKTQKDAMKYASQFEDDGNSYAIVEHGSRFDDARTASAIYEDSYDPSYDTILEELESPEDINQRFERISHSYPMIAKIIDEYISKGKGLNREQFISLLEDKEKLEDLGIDKAQLEEERKHANLDELFRLKPTVGKLDIQKHLLINYGNHMRDKFNQTRMNAKGANPDVLGNMEDYIRYNARYIPTSVFYYKSTALYRDITGRDYKSQFGRGGEGAQNDYQEILNNFIGSVVGLPNGADRTLNNIFNGVFGKPWVRAMFGDRAVTDALGFGMQAVTVLKLGMFRPTAAIAQLGTLMNVTTYSGFNGLTAQAMKDAALTGGNTTMSEKKMFNKIGLNREDTALETQALMNDKSIYNMTIKGLPIGKFLEKSMFMFNATDKYTRRVAALVAYRKAISEGKTDAEAVEEAREFVRKTNFDYSDKDAPQIFTRFGSIGKLLLQFRKYPVKEMEFIVDLFKSGDKKAITRFFGQYLVMAGMMGIPVAGAGDELAEWITGTSPTREMKKIMMEWAGNDATKKSFALVAMYGAPALAGVDFSRNIGIGDIVPTNGIEGPTLSTIANVYKAFRDHEGANNIMSNVAKELSPAYANYYQALTGRKRDWNKDVDGRNYSTGERIAKGLGFRPVSDSVEYDTSNIIKEKQDAEKAKKQKLINKYLDDPKSVTKKELHQAGIKGADIKRAQENLKKTKTEKALSNMPKKKQTEAKQTALSLAEFEEDL